MVGLMETMERTKIAYREEGRQARRDGIPIAELRDFPVIPPIPLGYVSYGKYWLEGWYEEDARMSDATPEKQ